MFGATNASRGGSPDYLKFDQDKAFGSVDPRSAFNQIRVLELAGYASTGRYVGSDVKAMRTQPAELATRHLANRRPSSSGSWIRAYPKSPSPVRGGGGLCSFGIGSKYRSFPQAHFDEVERTRDYELLELRVLEHLMG